MQAQESENRLSRFVIGCDDIRLWDLGLVGLKRYSATGLKPVFRYPRAPRAPCARLDPEGRGARRPRAPGGAFGRRPPRDMQILPRPRRERGGGARRDWKSIRARVACGQQSTPGEGTDAGTPPSGDLGLACLCVPRRGRHLDILRSLGARDEVPKRLPLKRREVGPRMRMRKSERLMWTLGPWKTAPHRPSPGWSSVLRMMKVRTRPSTKPE